MNQATIEVLIEPFKENDPGPHVHAVYNALLATGLEAEMGPFATTATGEMSTIIAVVPKLLEAGFSAGATNVQLRIETSDV